MIIIEKENHYQFKEVTVPFLESRLGIWSNYTKYLNDSNSPKIYIPELIPYSMRVFHTKDVLLAYLPTMESRTQSLRTRKCQLLYWSMVELAQHIRAG